MDIIYFILTLACCFLGGLLFKKLKIPGFMLVGAVAAAAFLNIAFDAAYMSSNAKLLAQIIAGAFIGLTIERSDLMRFREIMIRALLLIIGYLIMNIVLGLLICLVSPLDLMTVLFGAVPGGMSDVPLIAADMGADASKVVVMQFVRMIMGIGVFPGMITCCCCNEVSHTAFTSVPVRITADQVKSLPVFIITMGTAAVCGLTGRYLGVPAGTLLFSLIGVMLLKLIWNKYYLPPWSKSLAQLLSGAYIGSSIGIQSVLEMRCLVIHGAAVDGHGCTKPGFNCFACDPPVDGEYGISAGDRSFIRLPAAVKVNWRHPFQSLQTGQSSGQNPGSESSHGYNSY